MSSGVTWDTCADCHGSGFKVIQRAGDPVPGHPGYRFASTLYAPCDCRSFRCMCPGNSPEVEAPPGETANSFA